MKNPANLLLTLTLLFISFFYANAQYNVIKVAEGAVPSTQEGFFYSLPRTVLKIDLVYEKIEKRRGPLAEFTLNYLGTNSYITSDNTSYRLLNASTTVIQETDPDQLYFVQFAAEREKDQKEVSFYLNQLGNLVAFNDEAPGEKYNRTANEINQTIIYTEGEDEFTMSADYNRKKQYDTIRRTITIDTVTVERFVFNTSWVDKTLEDRAKEAAQQIEKIREGRFNLLTGYQEVNYGESMKYMDQSLAKLEKDYLELFLGKEVKSIEKQTVFVTPEKDNENVILLKLDTGSNITLNILPSGVVSSLPDQPTQKVNSLYYRIPDIVTLEIGIDGEAQFRDQVTINQLGVIATAPTLNTSAQFDPQTGSLRKITRK